MPFKHRGDFSVCSKSLNVTENCEEDCRKFSGYEPAAENCDREASVCQTDDVGGLQLMSICK